jgi:hypothetical protein
MKSAKPSDRHARPNQVIQIVATRTIRNEASNDKGAFQYLKSRPPIRRIKHLVGKGQYLGYKNQITAFVWLDDEPITLKAA